MILIKAPLPAPPSHKVRVLIADERELVRLGLVRLINSQEDMNVAAEVADDSSVVDACCIHFPDIVVLNHGLLHRRTGGALRAQIKNPKVMRTLIVGDTEGADYVRSAQDSGASGFVSMSDPPSNILNAIRAIHAGQGSWPLGIGLRRRRASPGALTRVELEVLYLVSEGLTNHRIAKRLNLPDVTVKYHLSRIMPKLGAKNRTQAVFSAMRRGLLDIDLETPSALNHGFETSVQASGAEYFPAEPITDFATPSVR